MQKRWNIKPQGDKYLVAKLAGELNIDHHLANILVQRGISNFDEAKKFFRPSLENLHNPFLMKDMDKAVERLEKAISNNEKILVYGDYDVDGTSAVSLVYSFLQKIIPKNIEYYIPDRYSEGYGISFQGIDYAQKYNFSLIIALDCGIKSIDKIDYANEKKIDFIICDHHLPGETIPDAVAVLDPKQADCNYPFKELCGCGVGFKLIQAYAEKNNIDFSELHEYLDLTAIAIAADIVPIVDENRILCFYGLEQINKNPRKGIKTILELAGVKKQVKINELVFSIAPRINAAGRIETGRNAVELLISDSFELASSSGEIINTNNTNRKTLDTSITQQALAMIENNQELVSRKSTVLFHAEWHKGVVGIVASRLIEKYYRPTIVLTESNGKATGSARSVKGFDVHAAIEACSELLEQFGGHKYAAGLTLKLENISAFQEKFEAIVSSTVEEHMLSPEIEIDAEISLEDITPKFYKILAQMEPFGPGNMAPVFLSKNLRDKGYVKIVGSEHLKMDIQSTNNTKINLPAIAFGQAKYFELIYSKQKFDACYTIEENEFNGNITLQLNIKDLKIC
jgi:single-stranded-DNA-specific exonuclease